ncbi:hypothetical protein Axy20_053 [Achromobacter phage vB_AxyS_19-32_Axy20]|nr:hypothetical protein Axy18_051 [Achromobacter phage vB_AxyS_19-32_Axy18]QDH84523.1 hypothetical protein Axy20_053 [Achromobacter phage vB_AxyS_19-32_Axy20]
MLIATVRNTNDPIPDVLKSQPKLKPGAQFYLNAFHDLDRERPVGFSLGPIGYFALRSYAALFELDEDETQTFIYVLCKMDDAYLKLKRVASK